MRTTFCSPIRCITSKWFVLFALALVAVAFLPTSAFAQTSGNCLADVSSANSCTSKDVKLSQVLQNSVNVFKGGIPGTNKCFEGNLFSFTATFDVVDGASSRRSNVGIYFGTGASGSALHGSCTDDILAPSHACAFVEQNGMQVPTATCGGSGYEELDTGTNGEKACNNPGTSADTMCGCGDTQGSDTTTAFGGVESGQASTLEVDNVTCPTNGATSIALNYCTSWFQPTATIPVCTTSFPNYPWSPAATAGSPSKCHCDTINIPVQPISPAITVSKTCTVGSTTSSTGCNAGAEGNTVVYTVDISNTTTAGNGGGGVVIDQICDTAYGNVFTSSTFTGAACAAGSQCTGANAVAGGHCYTTTTCPAMTPPWDIGDNSSSSCTFTVSQTENLTVNNTVNVQAHSDEAASATTSKMSNQITVTSSDAPTNTTTSLAESTPQAACVTERYTVLVQNNSLADETVTLNSTTAGGITQNALQDGRYGNLSAINTSATASSTDGAVIGTTCGVASGSFGLGTMASGQPGAVTAAYSSSDCVGGNAAATLANCNGGAYPRTLAAGTTSSNGGLYMCQFDGVICGNLTSTAIANCSAGIVVTDTGVNADLTGDDLAPNADMVNPTINPFTTKICVSAQ